MVYCKGAEICCIKVASFPGPLPLRVYRVIVRTGVEGVGLVRARSGGILVAKQGMMAYNLIATWVSVEFTYLEK